MKTPIAHTPGDDMADTRTMTHQQMSARLSEIGEIFAKAGVVGRIPNENELIAEQKALRAAYVDVLEGRRTYP